MIQDNILVIPDVAYNIVPYKIENLWYLSVDYLQTQQNTLYKVTIPQIYLGRCDVQDMYVDELCTYNPYCYVNLGFGDLKVDKTKDDTYYYKEIIEKEMTKRELEEQLGYKVTLIDEPKPENNKDSIMRWQKYMKEHNLK